jgi:hypothetical protein
MNNVYVFSLVEVRPKSGCKLLSRFPKARGAFLNSMVSAQNINRARVKLKSTLLEDGYILLSVGTCLSFKTYCKRGPKRGQEIASDAQKVGDSNGVWYSNFSCYE